MKKRFLIAGGGAPETEISRELMLHANTLTGADAYCFKAFAEAMEIIPYTLSENAGLNPIGTVTELRNRHAMVTIILINRFISNSRFSFNLKFVNLIQALRMFFSFIFCLNIKSQISHSKIIINVFRVRRLLESM